MSGRYYVAVDTATGDTLPGMATHDPAIEAAVALLAANGYKVSKARAPRVVAAVAALPCAHCGDPASRTTRIGGKGMRRGVRTVGVCEPCYRFGPRLSGLPMVPADPERAGRLYAVWRKAHHRYARRYAAADTGRTETRMEWSMEAGARVPVERPTYWHPIQEANEFADRILVAMQKQPMERRNVERYIGEAVAA